eukprot:scaffold3803_cov170-Amphora_coffeaeformis.AAC.1
MSSPSLDTAISPLDMDAKAVKSLRAWDNETPAAAATSETTTGPPRLLSTASITDLDGSCSINSSRETIARGVGPAQSLGNCNISSFGPRRWCGLEKVLNVLRVPMGENASTVIPFRPTSTRIEVTRLNKLVFFHMMAILDSPFASSGSNFTFRLVV